MPMAAWKQALAGTGAELAGGLEINYRPMPAGPARCVTPAEALGGAAAVLAEGADHVYLFNYFPTQASWSRADYLQTLQAMSSLEAIQKLPRCHAITWRDITGPQEAYRAPLPATGTALAFELPTGPAPLPGAKVTLELQLKGDATTAPPTAEINGTACPFQGTKPNGKSALVTYAVPATAVRAVQANSISVTAAAAVTVEGVEVRIAP